ncbi:MmgE/PrpD family protein [Bradyrhizobium sp. SSUT112]|uniref:MmgE/PrpD family protein n=1 Tax=Bradyrhizobium sp. SSUT112 TaxID=3040604 RepID=UPI00244C954B|nr:MmgE/PrpD family protein [Bradyrhizobium sp. SSUT112]MDH2352246.1 MmgE/PrpD family protein [Bradyrhizobium sp. SSUT112]
MTVSTIMSGPDAWAEILAEQISARDLRQPDARTAGRTRAAVITAFGRALSGAPVTITRALLVTSGVAMTGGSSLVFGTERRTSAVDAALINATAAVAGSEASRDAANSACIVALFGLCEERGKTGQEFFDALISGAEISPCLAPTLSPAVGQLGFSLFGGVAAAARVLELSRPRIVAALLMAGMANIDGPPDGPGGATAFMIGLSLRSGLLAALLAEALDEASCAEMIRNEGRGIPSPAAGNGAPREAAFDLLAVQSPPGADLWDQFERQAGMVLPRDQIAPLFERLETIDKVKDLATVSRLLQARGTQAAPRKVVFAARGTHEPEETNWVP